MTIQQQEDWQKNFKEIPLKIVSPTYDSNLTDLIMDLEYLRNLRIRGTTPPQTFMQIKTIFHTLESIGSARIEGNKTTIIEYIDHKLDTNPSLSDSIKEISNMEKALRYIDENIGNTTINRSFISDLHKMVVFGLSEEGSNSPGEYRNRPVRINNSKLVPPPFVAVGSYMDELFQFIAKTDTPKYDLLKIALAHHRFVWIHPFDNGNGRTVRLFTYALLVKLGFHVELARIINPTAIFCNDRSEYYGALERADRGDDDGFLEWVTYMLSGLKRELGKTDKLTDYEYLSRGILLPAIKYSLEKNILNSLEAKILELAIEKMEISNSDIKTIRPAKYTSQISSIIRSLRNKGYLASTEKNKYKYYINFGNNNLIRGIIFSLSNAGFLPEAQ